MGEENPRVNQAVHQPDCPAPRLLFIGTNSEDREAAIRRLLDQGRARLVATTLGADGCMVVTRHDGDN